MYTIRVCLHSAVNLVFLSQQLVIIPFSRQCSLMLTRRTNHNAVTFFVSPFQERDNQINSRHYIALLCPSCSNYLHIITCIDVVIVYLSLYQPYNNNRVYVFTIYISKHTSIFLLKFVTRLFILFQFIYFLRNPQRCLSAL